jgi:hypothetical protein
VSVFYETWDWYFFPPKKQIPRPEYIVFMSQIYTLKHLKTSTVCLPFLLFENYAYYKTNGLEKNIQIYKSPYRLVRSDSKAMSTTTKKELALVVARLWINLYSLDADIL